VSEANILLQVVDITHPNALEQAQVVEDTLESLEATDLPVLTVLNKIDAFEADLIQLQDRLSDYPDSILVSAKTGQGIDELLAHLEALLIDDMVAVQVCLPYSAGRLLSILHEQGIVESESHDERGTHLSARLPKHLVGLFAQFVEVA
jgi:GTP-binding protein HflX